MQIQITEDKQILINGKPCKLNAPKNVWEKYRYCKVEAKDGEYVAAFSNNPSKNFVYFPIAH